MTYLFMLLFRPHAYEPVLPPGDPFYRAERWVARRPWAQRVAALWVILWLALLLWCVMVSLWPTVSSTA